MREGGVALAVSLDIVNSFPWDSMGQAKVIHGIVITGRKYSGGGKTPERPEHLGHQDR
jgi:hypothetical protein